MMMAGDEERNDEGLVCAACALENIFRQRDALTPVGGVIFSDESFFNFSWHGNERKNAVPLVPAA